MINNRDYQYIISISIDKKDIDINEYPYNLKAIRTLNELSLHPNITYIVGENGTGKSTLLESIAVAYGFNPEGGGRNFNFNTANTHSCLSNNIRLSRGIKRPKDGYFLRAESFYNVASNIDYLDSIMPGIAPPIKNSYGGKSLHKQSHGESFWSLINTRFRGNGFYILDEPEAALSPMRQLALLRRIHELVKYNSQFIIATHSPILMSYPDSLIYSLEEDFAQVNLEETEHFKIMKDYLNNPQLYLDRIVR